MCFTFSLGGEVEGKRAARTQATLLGSALMQGVPNKVACASGGEGGGGKTKLFSTNMTTSPFVKAKQQINYLTGRPDPFH